jgi:hypothetical protein
MPPDEYEPLKKREKKDVPQSSLLEYETEDPEVSKQIPKPNEASESEEEKTS